MFKYSIWSASILSDIPLYLDDKATIIKLAEAKMMIDRSGTITKSFLIKNGLIQAFPDNVAHYKTFLLKKGEIEKEFHEEVFDANKFN